MNANAMRVGLLVAAAALSACATSPYKRAGNAGEVAAALARSQPAAPSPRSLVFLVLGGSAGQRVAVMREFIARLEQIVGIVEALERAGELPRVEASMFRVELASRRTELRRMTGEEAEGLLEIKRLMGMSPSAELTLLPGPGFKEERVSIDSLREQLPQTAQ